MPRLVLIVLALLALGATPQSTELEKLKAQFPPHVAGAVTAKSDPAVQEIFFKYQRWVNALSMETLGGEVMAMRKQAELDIFWAERNPEDSDSKMTSSQKHASRQNAIWLKQKFIPYLNRLAQFQRGR